MSDNIKTLLQDAQLRQQLENAANAVEATQIIVTTAAKKGYAFTQANVEAAIAQFHNPESAEMSESALEAIAGEAMSLKTLWGYCSFYGCA